MNARFRPLFIVSAMLSLACCDKPTPPAAVAPVVTETDNQLAEARDALQRQALEIETKSALMDKQLAEMQQSLKDRENTELRGSLDALKRQNDALRVQADSARQQSNAITQRIATAPLPNVAPPPVVQPDYSLFYDGLAPYGRWLDVNGYGYCWRPTIAVASWRPYVDGCWVWSSLGWAWQSNEPFGWATYHYGRWVNLSRYGWVWAPGNEWAPAWVAWRQSRDCVGWAPLPPEPGFCSGVYRDCDSRYGLGPTSYTFINTNQFVSSSYISVYAPVTRQATIFQHSVNVTQIVPRSGHGHEHAFVNQGGPPRGQMEQACSQPVPQRQVQTMHADQVPTQQQHQHGGHRDAAAPVAMFELPALTSGAPARHPDVREHIQRPALVSGFEGVPQHVATEIRQTIAQEKETAAVQQQPVHSRVPHGSTRHPVEASAVVNVPPQETVRPATAPENPVAASVVAPGVTMPVTSADPTAGVAVEQTRPVIPVAETPPTRGMPPEERRGEHHRAPATVTTAPSVIPAVVEPKAAEPAVVTVPPVSMPQAPAEPASVDATAERARVHAAEDQAQGAATQHRQRRELEEHAMAEKKAAEQTAAAEAEKTRMQTSAAQQAEATARQQRMTAEQTAAETEKARQQAETTAQQQRMAADQAAAETEKARQQAEATAQQQRMAADQAAAETEKARQQAAAMQQQRMAADQAAAETEKARQQAEATAQQQRMAADQAAAETEKARQQAAAMQQQQEQAAQQQRAAAERMANEQAAAEAARAQQAQAEAAAMQRQQEEARRAAEELQMRAQQEAAQRAAQEMAQRQAEEQARRQQEAEMQRAQQQARQEQMRAQQEAAQRAAQEMAQRQAEEQARRAQEEAQRAAAEAAQRAAAEAARNQPQPALGS